MRLLIVGSLRGQLTVATKMAMDKGASVTHAETIEQAMAVMRGRGADLMMVEVALDIRDRAATEAAIAEAVNRYIAARTGAAVPHDNPGRSAS